MSNFHVITWIKPFCFWLSRQLSPNIQRNSQIWFSIWVKIRSLLLTIYSWCDNRYENKNTTKFCHLLRVVNDSRNSICGFCHISFCIETLFGENNSRIVNQHLEQFDEYIYIIECILRRKCPHADRFYWEKIFPKAKYPRKSPYFLFISKQNVLFENAKPELHVT